LHGGDEFDRLGERLMALCQSFETFVYVHGRLLFQTAQALMVEFGDADEGANVFAVLLG
jgi:hypothetical protein